MDRFARFSLEPITTDVWRGPRYNVLIDGKRTDVVAGPEIMEDFIFMGHVRPGDWSVLESIYHEELNNVRQLNVDAHDLVVFFKASFMKSLQNEL